MRVLRTVQEHRRRTRRVLAAAGLASLLLASLGLAWWLARPGRPTARELGVDLPPGTRHILTERANGRDGEFWAVYLSSARPTEEVMELFGARAVQGDAQSGRFVLPDGTEVVVAPGRDVPATRLSPIRAVSEQIPLGTRSWIVLSRGAPPESTWTVSVPPMGES